MYAKHLELVQACIETGHPVAMEVLGWSDAERDDHESVCDLPVTRFACELARLWVDHLYGFGPLRVVHFRLCSLDGS